uniref:Uncharacterized protein n=1 Tax=Solanum lycopersicum TaxID=4081 RepID=A0A3Q7ERM7_SOLLC
MALCCLLVLYTNSSAERVVDCQKKELVDQGNKFLECIAGETIPYIKELVGSLVFLATKTRCLQEGSQESLCRILGQSVICSPSSKFLIPHQLLIHKETNRGCKDNTAVEDTENILERVL